MTMALVAAVLGLVMYQELAGVREGTFISALLVSFLARTFQRLIGPQVQVIF